MAKLVILGTSSAVPNTQHENTHMVVTGAAGAVLIDCGANPIHSLARAGIDVASLQALIVTHFHPDHVSGLPLLLLDLWLLGRKQLLPIYGLRGTLAKVESMMNLFEWTNWPGFYPVEFRPLHAPDNTPVLETPDVAIVASSTHHLVPSIGLRITARRGEGSLVYSSDTSPCDTLIRLARGAQVLIHEGTGAASGHSSPSMAGSIARQAGAELLTLSHYHTDDDPNELIAEAHSTFDGRVTVAHDLDQFEL